MIEFKVIEKLKPNKDLTNILKDFKYKVKLGQIKTIINTNLKAIIPTEYKITYPTTITLLVTNKLTHHLLLESKSCENYYKELMENYIKNDKRLSEKTKN